MKKTNWTSSDIRKLFRLEDRVKSKQTLLNAEERGEIPKASRITRGKIQVRQWTLKQLPEIGRRFGFLTKPTNQKIICKYIQKGGVLKTTTTLNEARILALNGIKVIVIGLDMECSITDVIFPEKNVTSLNEISSTIGLYHHFYENAPLSEVIKPTSIPTLDVIPETHELNILEKKIRHEKRREYLFTDKLIPNLRDYDVIIFDNSPSWNLLVENALTASQIIISPLGCNLLAYNAVKTNLSSILEFQEEMKLSWDCYIMYATLLERNSLSQQIYGQYLNNYSDKIIPIPLRSSAKGQESLVTYQSILEYAPSSNLAQDYYELINEVWNRIIYKDNINQNVDINKSADAA